MGFEKVETVTCRFAGLKVSPSHTLPIAASLQKNPTMPFQLRHEVANQLLVQERIGQKSEVQQPERMRERGKCYGRLPVKTQAGSVHVRI